MSTLEDTVVHSVKRWLSLPGSASWTLTPASNGNYVDINNVKIWYKVVGVDNPTHPPIVCLHGSVGNSDDFAFLVSALKDKYKLVLTDARGRGRSSADLAATMTFDLLADDVLRLLDHLQIPKAAIVGWSSGVPTALSIVMKHAERVDKVFAIGPYYSSEGVLPPDSENRVLQAIDKRAVYQTMQLSPNRAETEAFLPQLQAFEEKQPNWDEESFKGVDGTRIWLVAADHDEIIDRNQAPTLSSWLRGSALVTLPHVSHFAPLQDPDIVVLMVERWLVQPE